MIRKLAAVTAAAAACTLAMPVLPAAALSGTAALVQGADVLPGLRTYSVQVTNSDPNALLGGQSINGVLVQLPANVGITTAAGALAPNGWTVQRFSNGSSQSYLYRTDGSGIAPGGKLAFDFPADVAAPASRDQQGQFRVSLSADRGVNAVPAGGSLTSTVRILDVIQESLRGAAPAGVTDGSGTAGQQITYAFKVQNYARNSVLVQPELLSNGADTFGTPSPAAVAPVGAGQVVEFRIPTTLAGSADRNATFTAKATAPDAAATPDAATFEVQAPARLSLAPNSLTPAVVRQGKTTTFTARATKTGKPSIEQLTGTLSFAGNTIALADPARVAGGDPTTLTYAPSTLTGEDGKYDVEFAFKGVDGNDFAYEQTGLKLLQAVTLDATAPILNVVSTLPSSNGVQQTAAKNGDRITVSGTLDEANCAAALDFVELRTDNGQVEKVSVSKSGCSFSGSINPTFAAGASTFAVFAQATDAAGNPGTGSSLTQDIDNVKPAFTFAETQSARRILVRFAENGKTPVIGGCSETQWRIDEELLVADVLFSDGSPCVSTKAGPDNDRILVLNQDRDQDFSTNVTYTPRPRPLGDPVKDGAAADSLEGTIKTVIGTTPAPPVLVQALRNQGAETAVFDDSRYFTRFPGNDLEVVFSGARAGYTVRVLDAGGKSLGSQALDEDGTGQVIVPIGSTDGVYERQLQLVNVQGFASETTPFRVELDRFNPRIDTATLGANGRDISVIFNEKLQRGSDAAFEWEGVARDSNPDSTTGEFVSPASKVTGSGNTKTVTIQDTFTPANFKRADYIKRLSETVRYEDRAGNQVRDTQ